MTSMNPSIQEDIQYLRAGYVHDIVDINTRNRLTDIADRMEKMLTALEWVQGDGLLELFEAHVLAEPNHDYDAGFMHCPQCLGRNPVAQALDDNSHP